MMNRNQHKTRVASQDEEVCYLKSISEHIVRDVIAFLVAKGKVVEYTSTTNIVFKDSTQASYGILTCSSVLEEKHRTYENNRQKARNEAEKLVETILEHINALGQRSQQEPEFALAKLDGLKKKNLWFCSCRPGILNIVLATNRNMKETNKDCIVDPSQHDYEKTSSRAFLGDSLQVKIIGVIKSCFRTKYGVPRQGTLVPTSRGVVELNPEFDCSFLDGLDEFSHCWLIWQFHMSPLCSTNGKVSPPKLRGARKGVFATRSPHRPFPVGLSLVKIEHIDGLNLTVNGLDIIDGTPLLDIKPYHPMDSISTATFPYWIPRDTGLLNVRVEDNVLREFEARIEGLRTGRKGVRRSKYGGIHPFKFFREEQDFITTLVDLLAQDPRTTHQYHGDSQRSHCLFLDHFSVTYTIDKEANRADVLDITYSP